MARAWRWRRSPAALIGLVAGTAVYYLIRLASRPALDALAASHPALANKVLLNLGRHLSSRLRLTTDALRELSDSAG